MRLFIAINFDDQIKRQLANIQSRLRENLLRGNFTREENLHLTLTFLGEIPMAQVSKLRQIIDAVAVAPFELKLRDVGKFGSDGVDIWWVGVQPSSPLSALHRRITDGLAAGGFPVEQRDYRPHLTLVREAVAKDNFDTEEFNKDIPEITVPVRRISLINSERIAGKLVYTELYGL